MIRLETKGLQAGYDGTVVVDGVEIRVRAGEVLTLIGPNGAGKSTVLKTLVKQLEPVSGCVIVEGEDLSAMSAKNLSEKMAVMLTERMSTELLTCEDIVETGRYPYTGHFGMLHEEDHEAVERAMRMVDVLDLRSKDFMQISDGQRQRVMLARAIAQQPDIIVLDEPTSFLDIRYQLELLGVLRRLAHNENVSIIMSLHEINLARIVSDTVVCVKGNRVALQGPPQDIFTPEVINELYELEEGTYDPLTGAVRLPGANYMERII